ncbi:MAG: (Fe-S)-binding protein [Methanobacteriota archaeon]|nr:MAG: (Fe-S)-binding protein [Euryarchaeota archaeon]
MKRLDISKLDVAALLGTDACVRCGECTLTCPTGGEAQDVELITPRGKLLRMRDFVKRQYGLRARLFGPKGIEDDELEEFSRRVYECTICGQCKVVCPAGLDTIGFWENMREFLVANDLGPLPPHQQIVKSIENYDNPWMQPRTQRPGWSKRLGKEVVIGDSLKERHEVLYFVGCTAAYDPNIRAMAEYTARVLARAGVDFGTLGNDEGCCGSTMMRTGLSDSTKGMVLRNIERFEKAAPALIVTSCAGCYKTIRQDYPKYGKLPAPVRHITEFVGDLIESGKLVPEARVDRTVTFHDPCHLGRHNGLYDQPRSILEAIPGLRIVEMERNRDDARCCGAGGGVKTAFPELANDISELRVADAESVGCEVLCTSCPFCYQSLKSAIASSGSEMEMVDLMELLWQSLQAPR